jgi:hypothetical protein
MEGFARRTAPARPEPEKRGVPTKPNGFAGKRRSKVAGAVLRETRNGAKRTLLRRSGMFSIRPVQILRAYLSKQRTHFSAAKEAAAPQKGGSEQSGVKARVYKALSRCERGFLRKRRSNGAQTKNPRPHNERGF